MDEDLHISYGYTEPACGHAFARFIHNFSVTVLNKLKMLFLGENKYWNIIKDTIQVFKDHFLFIEENKFYKIKKIYFQNYCSPPSKEAYFSNNSYVFIDMLKKYIK